LSLRIGAIFERRSRVFSVDVTDRTHRFSKLPWSFNATIGVSRRSLVRKPPEVIVMPYRHTQRGTLTILVCLVLAAFDAALVWLSGQWPAAAVLLVLAVVGFLFSALTVEVGDHELRWHFGPGFPSYRLALDEIASIAAVRNYWWNGWGIRIGPRSRLYNVSGLDAVELRLKSGEIRRIGTDDPQGLLNALRAATRA
jgi:hypothetical protein